MRCQIYLRNILVPSGSDSIFIEMANLGLFSGTKSVKSVNVSFRLPYYTQWGQSLIVCGSEPVLGSWNVKKGLLLSPVHVGEELVWCGRIALPNGFSCEYTYYVVDDGKNLLRWEMGKKHKLLLPESVQGGELVELHDLWQTGADDLPFRSAFKNVVFQASWSLKVERPLGVLQNKLDQEDSALVHFKICCPNIEEETSLEKLVSKDSLHYDIICFHYYIQFHLHLQLSEAAEYARKKGVILKGDLPIGVDRNSVDTWVYPNLFRMNTSTGAPPDYFDKNGQNWGFPTYNWEEMSKDNYAWWRGRLTQMAKYFTAYRIDHILGFFRIWELPDHAMTGLIGKFRPSIPLSQEELEREGIWDFNRLSCPYIRKEFLQEKFGASWTLIASNFLNEYQKDRYENIVLIRNSEDARKFYPRFNLEDTSSFKDLDDHSLTFLDKCCLIIGVVGQRQAYCVHVTLESLMKDKELKTTIKDLVCGSGRSYPPLAEAVKQANEATSAITLEKQKVASGLDKISIAPQLNGAQRKETLAV
ncbi:putative 4-alpha-glucanotransferase [Tripterygium wilfordii]|uniref:4-alpha-glucanotransferase n=1 Tax=Tripterygium wilfordii TaxID=458696 RepID=A0A7J7DVJ6_TRIWF|nr:putative 4-alpha-glucanotransferase [Tripterygium wilfordii]